MKWPRWLRAMLIEGRDVRLWAELEPETIDPETPSESTIGTDPGADRTGIHRPASPDHGSSPAPHAAPCATGVVPALAAMYGGIDTLPTIGHAHGADAK